MLCFFMMSLPAAAETIEARLPSGITAYANFDIGKPSLPAILVLHGFLQTHQSPPMSTLADNLASRGYTVLSPTISLNINRRNQSMACEAAHTHKMEEGVAEVSFWVNWLNDKGYKNIIPVGFSSTSNIEILLYNAQGSHPAIKRAVLISLNPLIRDSAERSRVRAAMSAKRQADSKKLGFYSLGYCKNNYAATASSYLSYAEYDDSKVLELLKQTPVPTEVILGSTDTILPRHWVSRIKALNTKVTIIDDANHFFYGANEFDLAAEIENILKNFSIQKS